MATKKKSDWSQLPEELLHIISNNLEDHCFDVVHARSVCSHWQSSFAFPSCLSRQTYSLPSLPFGNIEGLCILEKFPMFLFRVHTLPIAAVSPSEFFLGRIGQDDHMELLPSSVECSVKVKILGSEPNLINMLDCQILPLGDQYRITWDDKDYRSVALLPLNNDGGGEEFVVVLNYCHGLLVLISAEMRWKRLENGPDAISDKIVVINPYSLVVTPLMSSSNMLYYLVPSGNDELFCLTFYGQLILVSRLDEEAGTWVNVNNLGDRLLFIGHLASFSYLAFSFSAKELPDGCGLSGNSIVFGR